MVTVPKALDATSMPQYKDTREQNRDHSKFITARTVDVRFACDPKEGVVLVGIANPKKYGDSRGSASIIRSKSNRSYLFVAAHVVELNSKSAKLGFNCTVYILRDKSIDPTQRRIPASIIAMDSDRDIAVLSVAEDLGVSTDIELRPFIGEKVWAAGYPKQLMNSKHITLSITEGTLASLSVPSQYNLKKHGYYHRVTSQVYFGSSGGGIWTAEGKMTAIVVVLFADPYKQPFEGYYYVKPVNEVIALLHDTWKYQEVFGD